MLHYIPIGEDGIHECSIACQCKQVMEEEEYNGVVCIHNKLDVYEYSVWDDGISPSDVNVPMEINFSLS